MKDITSPAVVKQILSEYGLKARKSLGQNFLVDGNVLRKMVTSLELKPGEFVLEIGPGLGALSLELAAQGARVLAVETDRNLAPWLAEQQKAYPEQLRFIYQDILETDIEKEIEQAFGEAAVRFQVCANIPYHITSPIIFKLLEGSPAMSAATLMMQKEVAGRIIAGPGGKDYGRLTVAVAYYCQVRQIMTVSRHCYYPQPDVDSAILRFEPYAGAKPFPAQNEKRFKAFLAYAFQHRRKTMLNISSSFYAWEKDAMRENLSECGLQENLRPENLSLREYIEFINFMEKVKSPDIK